MRGAVAVRARGVTEAPSPWQILLPFAPDPTNAAQYYAERRGAQIQPERRLQLAVLEEVVGCLTLPAVGARAERLRAAAAAWVEVGELEAWHPFSLRAICLGFGWSYATTRARLLAMPLRDRRAPTREIPRERAQRAQGASV